MKTTQPSHMSFLVLAGILLVVAGCVTQRIQTVDNQVYTCTKAPTLKAQIREDLKYIGRADSLPVLSGPDFAGGVKKEVILFGVSGQDDAILKGLFFISETMTDSNAWFNLKGCEMADKKKYFYNGYITEDLTRKCKIIGLTNSGYGNYLIDRDNTSIKKFFRGDYLYEEKIWVTSGNQTLFKILYLEKIPYYSHSQWSTKDETKLLSDEKELYHTFLENAETAFKKLP